MNLVDKQDVARFKGGEESSEVAFFFDGRTGGGFDIDAEFMGADLSQSGFTESWWAAEEEVAEGIISQLSGFNEDANVFDFRFLPDVFIEGEGAEGFAEIFFGGAGDGRVEGIV